MWESVISETIYLKEGITKVALIGVSMAIEAKTWHLVLFLAVFVGYRNKTPDNIVILKCEGITKVALIGVSMTIEAKTWHLVFLFFAVFVGYRNKTPDNIGCLYTRLLSKT